MKHLKIVLVLILVPGFIYSQTMKPGIAYARIPDLRINGFKLSNHFAVPTAWGHFDIGFDFILGHGNPNVVYSDSMNYNLEVVKVNNPDWYAAGLIPLTTTLSQFQISFGISEAFPIMSSGLSFGYGFYFSRTSSHFLIGPYEDTEVYLGINDYQNLDLMFPVNLRYLNAGMYLATEWMPVKDRKIPLGVELKYFIGLRQKHILTFGISFHLPVKNPEE